MRQCPSLASSLSGRGSLRMPARSFRDRRSTRPTSFCVVDWGLGRIHKNQSMRHPRGTGSVWARHSHFPRFPISPEPQRGALTQPRPPAWVYGVAHLTASPEDLDRTLHYMVCGRSCATPQHPQRQRDARTLNRGGTRDPLPATTTLADTNPRGFNNAGLGLFDCLSKTADA